MKNINLPPALVLFGIIAMGGAQSAQADLVVNGGFEDGTGGTAGPTIHGSFYGWTQTGNLGFTGVDAVMPHAGSNYDASLGPLASGGEGSLSQSLSTTAGANYVLDFWLDNQGGGSNLFSVNWNGLSVYNLVDLGSSPYTEYTATVTATGPSTVLQFEFDNATEFYLDDVSVTPVSTDSSAVPDAGSTSTLLGLAMFGLAAVRRKLK